MTPQMPPIYANGGYMVVPLVHQVTVARRIDGQRVSGPYPIEMIEEAVRTTDELAEHDGEQRHRSYRG